MFTCCNMSFAGMSNCHYQIAFAAEEEGHPLTGPFLSLCHIRATDDPKSFSCDASAISLHPGHFPGMIETDLGNGDALYIDRAIFDATGNFVGVAYRQSGGCEVSVFL